jgi:hypothetical protein
MRRKILSYDVSDETIFLFFSPLGNSILNLVLLSGQRRWSQTGEVNFTVPRLFNSTTC